MPDWLRLALIGAGLWIAVAVGSIGWYAVVAWWEGRR